jgi:hypothetical protein
MCCGPAKTLNKTGAEEVTFSAAEHRAGRRTGEDESANWITVLIRRQSERRGDRLRQKFAVLSCPVNPQSQ